MDIYHMHFELGNGPYIIRDIWKMNAAWAINSTEEGVTYIAVSEATSKS